jgi:hypothetical protein
MTWNPARAWEVRRPAAKMVRASKREFTAE